MGRTACTEPQCLYKGALYLYFAKKGFKNVFFYLLSHYTNVGYSVRRIHPYAHLQNDEKRILDLSRLSIYQSVHQSARKNLAPTGKMSM